MTTITPEVRTEAAIYAEGTRYTKQDLLRAYDDYLERCQRTGEEPDDCQRFFAEYIGE